MQVSKIFLSRSLVMLQAVRLKIHNLLISSQILRSKILEFAIFETVLSLDFYSVLPYFKHDR